MDTFSNVTSGLLNELIAVDVGEQAETKTITRTWIGETINCETGFRGIEDFTNTVFHFIVANRAPVGRLGVSDCLVIICVCGYASVSQREIDEVVIVAFYTVH